MNPNQLFGRISSIGNANTAPQNTNTLQSPTLAGQSVPLQGSVPSVQGSTPGLQASGGLDQRNFPGDSVADTQGVLGAAASQPVQQGPSPQQVQAQRDAQVRGNIDSQFSNTLGFLNNQVGQINARRDQLTSRLGRDVREQRGLLDQARSQGRGNIEFEREQQAQDKAQNLRDLTNNIRSAFQSGTLQLGNLGAGDSSATGQFAFALANQQNEGRAQILQQAAQNDARIGLALQNLDSEFNQQVQQLSQFERNERERISDALNQQLNAIEEAKLNADQDRLAALNSLQLDVFNSAQTEAQSLASRLENTRRSLALNKATVEDQVLAGFGAGTQAIQGPQLNTQLGAPGRANPSDFIARVPTRDEEEA